MAKFSDKIKLTIFVEKEKSKDLKKRAIDMEMCLSDYLVSCSDNTSPTPLKGKGIGLNNEDP